MSRIAWFVVLLLPTWCLASAAPAGMVAQPISVAQYLATGKVHIVKFAPLEEADVEMQCESTQAPQALATPHPSLAAIPDDGKIVVNFIVGADGQVYSPFVLDGVGGSLDRKVVELVRHWRYRPALCNGVPTDSEVKVQLSSR